MWPRKPLFPSHVGPKTTPRAASARSRLGGPVSPRKNPPSIVAQTPETSAGGPSEPAEWFSDRHDFAKVVFERAWLGWSTGIVPNRRAAPTVARLSALPGHREGEPR